MDYPVAGSGEAIRWCSVRSGQVELAHQRLRTGRLWGRDKPCSGAVGRRHRVQMYGVILTGFLVLARSISVQCLVAFSWILLSRLRVSFSWWHQ